MRERGRRGKGSEKRALEQDMIRLSLVINLSEAVRTFFKSPTFTFQKLPPNPQTCCPCLGAVVKVYAQKLKQKIKKYRHIGGMIQLKGFTFYAGKKPNK